MKNKFTSKEEGKLIIGAACASLVVSFNVSAAMFNADWKTPGDNLITYDSDTGLEWLDLTASSSRSFVDVSSQFDVDEEFEGWRYASVADVAGFLDNFGGNNTQYTGWSTLNNGLFDVVSPYWGDLYCVDTGCATGEGYSDAFTGDVLHADASRQHAATLLDLDTLSLSASQDYVLVFNSAILATTVSTTTGSALIRDVNVVPIPAAVWLFGSGLLGLMGVTRRKKCL
jgi:hypothetical protein